MPAHANSFFSGQSFFSGNTSGFRIAESQTNGWIELSSRRHAWLSMEDFFSLSNQIWENVHVHFVSGSAVICSTLKWSTIIIAVSTSLSRVEKSVPWGLPFTCMEKNVSTTFPSLLTIHVFFTRACGEQHWIITANFDVSNLFLSD